MEHHNLTTGVGDFSAVTLLSSNDGGRSWDRALPPPQHVVAASPVKFSEGNNRLGFRSPSNIVQGHGNLSEYYYATVTSGWGMPGSESACSNYVDPLGLQHFCTCVMRTRDLTDPKAWRAWDGHGFSATLHATPYEDPPPDPRQHVCQPVSNVTYPSVLWSAYYGRYIMLGTAGGHDKSGWSFQLSDDLVHWGDEIMVSVERFSPQGNTTTNSTENGFALYAYPSLLDPESPRTNYDTVGQVAYIYLMGRETPLPQHTHPMGYYAKQSILRAQIVFQK